jgi:pimeloyl-ACP methyl ester carboxylesterase
MVHANGVDLYVEVIGAGLPVLGIHGTPSSALLWVDAAAVLAEDARVIIYDRRGFGRSSPSGSGASDLEDHVEDAVALLEQLDALPAAVIGRSTGGLIALALAQRHPESVRVLVLLEPALFTLDPGAARWAAGVRDRVLQDTADDPAAASEVVFRAALGETAWEGFPAELRELFAEASPAVLAEMRGRGLDLSADPLVLSRDELAQMDIPTLLVSSEDSSSSFRAVNERLAEVLPRSEHVVVPGGHVIDPAHSAVRDFLGRHPA